MPANYQLMKVKPNVAFLDDDIELANDLMTCLAPEMDITHFTSLSQLQEAAKCKYGEFISNMSELFSIISSDKFAPSDVEIVFQKIVTHKPYSVALIDLDLGNNDTTEGFKIGESINRFHLKPLIYSASETIDIVMDLINQGDIYGYLNKSSDLYEDLIPTVHHINEQFYQFHFNVSHLAYLCKSFAFNEEISIKPDSNQYVVYNANNEIVTI